MCWSLPVDGRGGGGGGGGGVSQMAEQIQGLCKLMDCTDINIPSYATQALLAVPLWHRSPLRLQQFIKTFASIHSKTTLAINSRCNVLKVSRWSVVGGSALDRSTTSNSSQCVSICVNLINLLFSLSHSHPSNLPPSTCPPTAWHRETLGSASNRRHTPRLGEAAAGSPK